MKGTVRLIPADVCYMPNLSEFLGAILQEATKARMLADLESIKIAEYYYQDKYMKNLPIPHFKMPDLTLEMPVEVEQIDVTNVKSNNEILNSMKVALGSDLKNYIVSILMTVKEDGDIKKSVNIRAISSRISLNTSAAATRLSKFSKDKEIETLAKKTCDKILNTCFIYKNSDFIDANRLPIRLTVIYDAINELLWKEFTTEAEYKSYFKNDREQIGKIVLGAKDVFYNSVTQFIKQNETVLNIISKTDEIVTKYSDTKYLTFFKITIKEQDYEWTIGESDDENGEEERRLVVE